MSTRIRLGAALAYAVITFLSFPHPIGDAVLDLGFALAWVGPPLLALTCSGLSPWRALRFGFLAGLLAHSAILHWIYVVTVTYGHVSPVVGVIALVALAAYLALFPAAFAGGMAWVAARGTAGPLFLAALWTVLDHARHFFLTGFPWAAIGYAQHENPGLMGLAAFTGVYGLSFVTALGGFAVLSALRALRAKQRLPRSASVALAVVIVVQAIGYAVAPVVPEPGLPTLRVALLQGNVDQGSKWSPEWAQRILANYEELARRGAAQGADMIVWPETALPGSLLTDPFLEERVAKLARETGALHVVGGVGIEGSAPALRFYDSAFVVDREGRLIDRYDKSHLVPYGEYVPLRAVLGLFLSSVARGIAPDNVTPGDGPRTLTLAAGSRLALPVGVPICYELLFPDLVRRFVGQGAEILVAITNDAWYGRTGAPYQFLAITALRAAENRVWIARAANTGVSAFIDPRGRVVSETRIFERDVIVADVPLRAAPDGGSFYARHGDVFAWANWLVLLGFLIRLRKNSATQEVGRNTNE